jgi:hypothetical protein
MLGGREYVGAAVGVPECGQGAVERLFHARERSKCIRFAPRNDRQLRQKMLATRVTRSTLAAYTAAGFWGDETIYQLAAHQRERSK